MAWRVCSLNSNLTGRPVFFCRTVARSAVYPPAATSSTRMATTSHPRSLLSIARSNIARSRLRPSIWSLVLIDQTCLGRNGGFAPVSFPLFQGTRLGWVAFARSCMAILLGLVTEDEKDVPPDERWNQVSSGAKADFASGLAANSVKRLTLRRPRPHATFRHAAARQLAESA